MGTPARSNLWRHHDFRLLWVGYSVSKLGSAVSAVVVPLIAVDTLQASPFMVGVLAAAAWLPWLLFSLPVGAWIDRLRRRPVMITNDVMCFGLFASVPVASPSSAIRLRGWLWTRSRF